ncbi:NAD(P)H-dependent oxidoreductase [Candidatus Marsarchaeota archaeon]|jgi:chromate reductase|nr:NAD(P)H-dependent oxidoreductase [Candidatus Marsarchaeota archaeon]
MENNEKIKILAFAGSLRKDSYNKALIKAAKELAPENAEVEIFDLDGIPLYNQDNEPEMPEQVKLFKKKIKAADAVLIATPEYNRSIPGVLKNAIDWASRPYGDNSFDDKPVAALGATGGSIVGTSAAQIHLRQIFSFLNMHPLERPLLFIGGASEKIENGDVVEEELRDLIKSMMLALVAWTIRIKHKA